MSKDVLVRISTEIPEELSDVISELEALYNDIQNDAMLGMLNKLNKIRVAITSAHKTRKHLFEIISQSNRRTQYKGQFELIQLPNGARKRRYSDSDGFEYVDYFPTAEALVDYYLEAGESDALRHLEEFAIYNGLLPASSKV